MPAVLLSPLFNSTPQITEDGNPASGYKLFSYEAGSFDNLAPTYTTIDGNVANTNPMEFDSSGRLSEAIWLEEGQSYNLVLTLPDETTVVSSFDNISGILNSTGENANTNVWLNVGACSYVTTTQFITNGNNSTVFKAGNRVRLTYDLGYLFGTCASNSFSLGQTTTTIVVDSGSLDPSISVVEYSVNIAQAGAVVDAGGVTFTNALSYPTANTVGNKLKSLDTSLSDLTDVVNQELRVLTTTGTSPNYVLTPDPASTSYSTNQVFNVKFHASAFAGTSTLNVNGLGARDIVQYDYFGDTVPAIITDGHCSVVMYDGTNMVLTNILPPEPVSRTFYILSGNDASSGTATFYLTAGTWQLTHTMNVLTRWPGNATYTAQQTATVVGVGAAKAIAYIDRGGGSGHAYFPGTVVSRTETLTVSSSGNVTLNVSAMSNSLSSAFGSINNTTGALTGGGGYIYGCGWNTTLSLV